MQRTHSIAKDCARAHLPKECIRAPRILSARIGVPCPMRPLTCGLKTAVTQPIFRCSTTRITTDASRLGYFAIYVLRSLRKRQAATRPVESKMRQVGSGVEIGGGLPGDEDSLPVIGIIGTAQMADPPIVPPPLPAALVSPKNRAPAGVPPPSISPAMGGTKGSMIWERTGLSSICRSGSPASETGIRGASETWLPQRVREICWPSVINVSPTARRIFFEVQKTSSPLR